TEPGDYSGTGAMQALPDNGTFYYTNYFSYASRLDFAINFIKTGTHYIWIRAYAPSTASNTFHMGINFIEDKSAARIGDFKETGRWEWINAFVNDSTILSNLEVEAIGTQGVSLWFARDGVIADKIVLTTDPDFIPTGYGPDVTVGIKNNSKQLLPDEFRLDQNYPNPFNPETIIKYSLPKASFVKLKIYDTYGRVVRKLENGYKNSGSHKLIWNATNNLGIPVSSGFYFARLETKSLCKSIKMLYMK
ncbi:MAG: FlgD immunoglobulin-like domain containing protein, partial [Calditrichaceae bacterium]